MIGSRFPLDLRNNRLLRMFVAGVVNTLFGFMVFSGALLAGAPSWAALILGLLCGTVFNFFTTGHYVFRQLSLKKYPRFLACYLLVYLINLALIHLLFHTTRSDILSQAIVSLPIALFSYFLMARYVFNPTNHDRTTRLGPDSTS